MLQGSYYWQESCKKSMICRNLLRACKNNSSSCKILQESCNILLESSKKCIFPQHGYKIRTFASLQKVSECIAWLYFTRYILQCSNFGRDIIHSDVLRIENNSSATIYWKMRTAILCIPFYKNGKLWCTCESVLKKTKASSRDFSRLILANWIKPRNKC